MFAKKKRMWYDNKNKKETKKMEIVIGKTSGFCFGVKNAVSKTIQELETTPNLYCLGELIHNKEVTDKLEQKGLTIVNTIEEVPEGASCVIRAHGITKQEYEVAKEKKNSVIDLTCPKVLLIHQKIEQYAKKGYTILLYGKKEHPETKGNASFGGENCYVLEKKEDVDQAVKQIQEKGSKKIAILSQTTFGVEEFHTFTNEIQTQMPDSEILVENTICNSTKLRQKEAEEIAKTVDTMLVIGGKHSSNTKELYEVAKKQNTNTIHIETAEELKDKVFPKEKIGIIAGASTPQSAINKVVEWLQNGTE